MALHIEHIEEDDPGLVVPYWHDQHLVIGVLALTAARGVRRGLGVSVTLPLRLVRDRIQFQDLARQPYTPPNPDTHHRNETLAHVADPQLGAILSRQAGPWTLGAGVGTSIPIGRTEPDPFELGRQGLPHQHIQFGTGTWIPILNVVAARGIGRIGINASATARLSYYENSHGYQAGNRFHFVFGGGGRLSSSWVANAAVSLDREKAETWSGKIEEEGNLGRSDLFLLAGVSHLVPGTGLLGLSVQVPLRTWATGEQVRIPIVASATWSK
jgi:hypothetical protein